MPISPGIYVREYDFSEYAQQLSRTIVAMLGGATKGPVGKPIRVTSEHDLIKKFGKPIATDYGLLSALQYLKYGNNLLYVRVAKDAKTASRDISGFVATAAATAAAGSISISTANPSGKFTIYPEAPSVLISARQTNTAILVSGSSSSAFKIVKVSEASSTSYDSYRVYILGTPSGSPSVTVQIGNTSKSFTVTGGNAAVAATSLADSINDDTSVRDVVVATPSSDGVTFFYGTGGSPGEVPISIGQTTAETAYNTYAAILSYRKVLKVKPGISGSTVSLVREAPGVIGNAPIVVSSGASGISVTNIANGADASYSSSASTVMTVYAASPGSWGNAIGVAFTPTSVIGAPSNRFDMYVYEEDANGNAILVERFTNLSLNPDDAEYIESVVNNDEFSSTLKSEYVSVVVASAAKANGGGRVQTVSGENLIPLKLGITPQTEGTDGLNLTDSDYIGFTMGQVATGLQALRNPEKVEFNLLAIPGVSSGAVIAAALSLAEDRGDFLYVIDPPFGLTRDGVVNWHNGRGGVAGAPKSPLNSSYGALYWPWVMVFDPYLGKRIWLPPSGLVVGMMAQNDEKYGPWWATAGHVRGVIPQALNVEYSADIYDRHILVGDSNRVNPIVNFENGGITIFGNRTTQRRPTALDSVHIRRMVLYAEKLCATAVRVLVFNPNDPKTWEQFRDLCNYQLSGIKAARGLEEFRVICDETTNPPSQRQNKTMRGKLLLKPIEAAEIIQLDFALFATGAEFNENF